MANETAVRRDTGKESTECVKKERFQGNISALPGNAKAAADEVLEHRDKPGEVLFWTDG